MEKLLHYLFSIIAFTFIFDDVYAQAPNIGYSPSTNVYTAGTAIPNLTPTNTGGAVGSFAFGTGITLGSGAGFLNKPYGMAVDATGNIYVANYGSSTISKYNSSGTYVGTFGSSTISNPAGLAFGASGNAYVLNYNRTIMEMVIITGMLI